MQDCIVVEFAVCNILQTRESGTLTDTSFSRVSVRATRASDRPTFYRVTKTICHSQLKNNKAPGSDTIAAECIIKVGETLNEAIHGIIKRVWKKNNYQPKSWKENNVTTIHKMGDKIYYANYLGISLIIPDINFYYFFYYKTYKDYQFGDVQFWRRKHHSTFYWIEWLNYNYTFNVNWFWKFSQWRKLTSQKPYWS